MVPCGYAITSLEGLGGCQPSKIYTTNYMGHSLGADYDPLPTHHRLLHTTTTIW